MSQRVSIITICSRNYGNRLQNYALTQVLSRQFDAHPETLRFVNKGLSSSALVADAKHLAMKVLSPLKKEYTKRCLFDSFTKCRVPTRFVTALDTQDDDVVYVIGSDQCWNPTFNIGKREDGLQCAAGASAPKISYAASFGLRYEDMSSSARSAYAGWLPSIQSISVREDEAARIVGELTDAQAQVVLDPTMLLTAADWSGIERRPKIDGIENGRYCLKYVLGDDEQKTSIDSIASTKGLRVVDLTNNLLPVGPEEFVWLIHHADLVCTDSFHASVFSLLFHKPFVVYQRAGKLNNMGSRFDTLKRYFNISENLINGENPNWDSVWNYDWDTFESKLGSERQRSLDWLRCAYEKAVK